METARSDAPHARTTDVVTFLVVEWPGQASSATLSQVQEALRATEGSPTPWSPNRPGADTVAAAFRLTADAVRAAIGISRATWGLEPMQRPHAALCTMDDPRSASQARAQLAEMLRGADCGQTLVAATTAALTSGWLPSEVELILQPPQPSRPSRPASNGGAPGPIYELRPSAPPASNLGWAHRAVVAAPARPDDALTALRTAWTSSLRSGGRAVLLVGEEGAGTTAVAAQLALRVHAEGALVLYGRWDRGRSSTTSYQAIREALGTYADACPVRELRQDLRAHLGPLGQLVPELGAKLGARRPPGKAASAQQATIVDAVDAWLDRIATRRPVLVVLDDLQWADPSSLAVVDALRQVTRAVPVLLVVTTRRPEIQPADHVPGRQARLRALVGDPDAEVVSLAGSDGPPPLLAARATPSARLADG